MGSTSRSARSDPVLIHHRLQDLHDPRTAPVRSHLHHARIIEDEGSDPITLIKDTPGSQRRQLRRHHRLHRHLGTKEHVDPLINHQQRRPITLLGEDPDIGRTRPRGHLPVDRARIIAWQIVTELFEVQAATPNARGVTSSQQAVNGLFG